MNDASPGVRRLCVCVRAPQPGLLDAACRIADGSGLYTEHIRAEGLELGFASPGVDEAALVTELVAALRAATALRSNVKAVSGGPSFAAFHVGITRVVGDDLRGSAATQVQNLVLALTREVTPAGAALIVGISAGLFDDIQAECGFDGGWRPVTAAKTWFRVYPADEATGADETAKVVDESSGFKG